MTNKLVELADLAQEYIISGKNSVCVRDGVYRVLASRVNNVVSFDYMAVDSFGVPYPIDPLTVEFVSSGEVVVNWL